ncbi:MAG: CHASE2 domain-containing protein [Deltaproteobacteria bacterium]|nr:CHASE2 domain-containing protein [Deltaproteobacteria bacterium]
MIGLVMSLGFLFITFTGIFDFTDPIELKTFDFRARIAAPDKRNPHIELVAITEEDLSKLGRFPWPRNILAQGIGNLALAGAKVIAPIIPFPEPEESAGLKAVSRLKELYGASGLGRGGAGLAFYKEMSKALTNLDNDAKLYKAIKKAGNVVLPVYFDTWGKGSDAKIPDFVARHALKRVKGVDRESGRYHLIQIPRLKPLLPSFAEAASGIGHLNLFPDRDGYIRHQTHVVLYQKDTFLPSLALTIVRLFMGIKAEDVSVVLGEGISLKAGPSSNTRIPVSNPRMMTLINWSRGPDAAFHQTPFAKVYRNQFKTSLFRDKIVIIGPTAPGIGDRWMTPLSRNLPGVEIIANSVANILNQTFISRPLWIPLVELAALVLFGLFLSFVLPWLRAGTGAVSTAVLLIGYGAFGIFLFYSSGIWLKMAPPLLLLILGYLLVIFKRFLLTEKRKGKVEPAMIFGTRARGYPGDMGADLFDTETRPTLGRYEVTDELGRGAMGVVFKGEDPEIRRTVAIKTISLSDFDEQNVIAIKDRFLREVESAGLLTHPNIVTVYDCGAAHNLIYIAMEYLDGENLERYTKPGVLLPLRETLRIAVYVAEALEYAHGNDIVHRDIKPANIMRLKGTKEIKVTDFGIARIMSSFQTKTSVVPGTPSYMSPEQVAGKKVDGRSDIFSLGVVLFVLLTGRKPFRGKDITSLMFNIVKESHPSPRDVNSNVPRVVERIINKALEKDMEKRYQRAGHMAEHLRQVVDSIDDILARKNSQPDR